MNRRFLLVRLILALLATAPLFAMAQTYPSRPVHLIVPATPGGPPDITARILGQWLSTAFAQPVIIENKAGASQTIGADYVAKARPDGYTLLQSPASIAINAILMQNLPYDTVKDFAPVSLTYITPYVFAVSAQSKIQSMAELVKFIRDNSDKATYGTTGQGSPQQLATLLFVRTLGLPAMTEIQYKGSSAAHPDLISNRIDLMIDSLAATSPHIKSGSLRALAVTTSQRNANFPNVPTAIEAGVTAYDFTGWGGVFAPAGTPRDIVIKLNEEVEKALSSPDVRKRFDDLGLVPKSSKPQEFGDFLVAEITRWKALLAAKKP
jgi:tripartite-type tricarboxylate transporter receptor subunit TctC